MNTGYSRTGTAGGSDTDKNKAGAAVVRRFLLLPTLAVLLAVPVALLAVSVGLFVVLVVVIQKLK